MVAPAPAGSVSSEPKVSVLRPVINALTAEARRVAPHECCGLLLGRGETVEEARPAANVASDRRRRFEIDPQALVDAFRAERCGGPRVLGYYHSHPFGPAGPSAADRALAPGDGRLWAIVTKKGVTFWRDEETGFAPLFYTIADV